MARDKLAARIRVERQRCPYCHDAIPHGEAPAVCAQCHALHHKDCLQHHGACATCAAPDTRTREDPASQSEAASERTRPGPRWTAAIPAILAAAIGLLLSYDSQSWRFTTIMTGFFAIVGLLLSWGLLGNSAPPRR